MWLDAPSFNVEAATAILLIDLTSPAAEDANQQPQEPTSPDQGGPSTDTDRPTVLPLL